MLGAGAVTIKLLQLYPTLGACTGHIQTFATVLCGQGDIVEVDAGIHIGPIFCRGKDQIGRAAIGEDFNIAIGAVTAYIGGGKSCTAGAAKFNHIDSPWLQPAKGIGPTTIGNSSDLCVMGAIVVTVYPERDRDANVGFVVFANAVAVEVMPQAATKAGRLVAWCISWRWQHRRIGRREGGIGWCRRDRRVRRRGRR